MIASVDSMKLRVVALLEADVARAVDERSSHGRLLSVGAARKTCVATAMVDAAFSQPGQKARRKNPSTAAVGAKVDQELPHGAGAGSITAERGLWSVWSHDPEFEENGCAEGR
jgi:hypothetical protein